MVVGLAARAIVSLRRRHGASIGAALAAAAMSLSAPARAQDPDARARADALFREGRQAATAGDYARACEKFAASQRLDPSTGTLLNLGNCEERQDHLSSARNYYRTALGQLGGSDPRVAPAGHRLMLLEARMPRLTITLPSPSPPGLTVRCDGTPVPAGDFGVAGPIDPGEHEVLVSAPGYMDRREVVVLAEKQTREVVATPGAPEQTAAAEAPSPATPPAAAAPERTPSSARTVGWIAAGTGAAGLVLAAVSGAILVDDKSTIDHECPGKQCLTSSGLDAVNRSRTWLPINTASWIVGLAGAGVGAYLVLANPGGGRVAATAGLAIVPNGLLASARTTF
jgi:hypothetical protein